MEKQIGIMKQSLELSETILEGLQHIQKLLGEGKFEQTIYLYEDVLLAFSAIEKSVEPLKDELNSETFNSATTNLKYIMELVVDHYEEKNYAKVQEVMQFTLVPQFKKVKQELELAFKPYLQS